MGPIGSPEVVQLMCGIIAGDARMLGAACARLGEALGTIARLSEIYAFDYTDYYEEEMGAGLLRQFVAFRDLVDPCVLADVKRRTNELEQELSTGGSAGSGRAVNLDPGYVCGSKLVLASTKDFSHRIYLSGGIYAEVTLMFRSGKCRSLDWTYPDFRSGRYDEFLLSLRHDYLARRPRA